MAKVFEEAQDVLPRDAFLIMASALTATAAFMLVCCFIEPLGVRPWMAAVAATVFAAAIVFCKAVKLRVSVEDGVIRVRLLKGYAIPFGEVIDHRVGDMDEIRNYSGWGTKKVSYKNLVCAGCDRGVSLKLTGRRVLTISLRDPEGFASILPPAQG
ncbi:MAG: hypothetical protein FWH47_06025 [Methanomassiliicoccaceae archaeon]|nr:hypothetical protein [Methanomassiliicoccaceae archaeon]